MLILAGAAAVALQLYGLYRPAGPPEPPWFPAADKVGHLLGFAIPVLLVLCALTWYAGRRPRAGLVVWLVIGLFAAHGVVSEIIQARLYANRSGDLLDVVADWAGIAVGAAAYTAVRPALIRRTARDQVAASP